MVELGNPRSTVYSRLGHIKVDSCAVCGMLSGVWLTNYEKKFRGSVVAKRCCINCYWPVKAVIEAKILTIQGKEEE